MMLIQMARAQRAVPADPASPPLCVSKGWLTEDDEARVKSAIYFPLPYVCLLNLDNPVVQRYHSGRARFLAPIDVLIEAPTKSSLEYVEQLYTCFIEFFQNSKKAKKVNELEPGVLLLEPFEVIGRRPPENQADGFARGLVRLGTSSL